MKVILLKDVKGLGKKGDVVSASDGYARNFLFPKKIAAEATETSMHILSNQKEAERRKKLAEIEEAQKVADSLKGKNVKITTKSGEGGRLFGAITGKDISEALKKQYNVQIDKKKIVTDTIKQLGTYEVELKIYPEVSAKITVTISQQ